MVPSEISGYKVVSMKVKEESEIEHFMYIKEHSVREKCPEKPIDKTIFILGVPPFVTQEMFQEVFSQFGKVSAVYFHKNPCPSAPPKNTSTFFKDHPEVKGYRVGYVVFSDGSSVYKVMSLEPEEKLILTGKGDVLPWGMKKWCREYNDALLEPEMIQAEIDTYMAEYDEKVAEEEKRQKMLATEPDEEGWVTVTKKGRRPGFARKESVHDKIIKKQQQRKEKRSLLNFYKFQIRESKMSNLLKLREKFEEDKKKIDQMKKLRKFKPF